jgi:2,3-bisphosphoglycerate-independent phosphoglycerate mutase
MDQQLSDKVLMVIIDGMGFNRVLEKEVFDALVALVSKESLDKETEIFQKVGLPLDDQNCRPPILAALSYLPTWKTLVVSKAINLPIEIWPQLASAVKMIADSDSLSSRKQQFLEFVHEKSSEVRYANWSTPIPFLHRLMNTELTYCTKTTGKEVGYEDIRPEIQGNSETGHQQLANLTMASQLSFQIASDIQDGTFELSPKVRALFSQFKSTEACLNVIILLQGEFGDDGRVHSSWDHLKEFLRITFDVHAIPPERVKFQAILDGRDSPPHSSIQPAGNRYNFLNKFVKLLDGYKAIRSLTWIVGRSESMDRDYVETRAETDFRLLVQGEGKRVADVDEAIEFVKSCHDKGITDNAIPPIVVGPLDETPPHIRPGDFVVDLNFRADRQRIKIASLLGAREFLLKEASIKGQQWKLDWLTDSMNLHVYGMADYHPELVSKYGLTAFYESSPHKHNILDILSRLNDEEKLPFHYLLAGESTKALHMGYFIRGRREAISHPECETRRILPSHGSEHGVLSDNDYWKTPYMRTFPVLGLTLEGLYEEKHNLIIVNFSNCDMIGHLSHGHFDACTDTLQVIDHAMSILVPAALQRGFHVVITSDHGNIDDPSPAHGLNDVVSIFLTSKGNLSPREPLTYRARQYDVASSVVELLGYREEVMEEVSRLGLGKVEDWMIGKSLVSLNGQ